MFFALFGSLFLMTQYWQLVHGYSPLEAGVHLLPYAATMMIVAPMSARLVERFGTKRIVLTGLSLVTTGLLAAVDDRRRLPVPDGDLVLHDHGRRHGHDDGARHRIGDGLAAP